MLICVLLFGIWYLIVCGLSGCLLWVLYCIVIIVCLCCGFWLSFACCWVLLGANGLLIVVVCVLCVLLFGVLLL